MNTKTLICSVHFRPKRSVTRKQEAVSIFSPFLLLSLSRLNSLTKKAKQGTKKGTGLKDRGNVARDGTTVGLGDVEISQEALACNSRAHKGRIVAETMRWPN